MSDIGHQIRDRARNAVGRADKVMQNRRIVRTARYWETFSAGYQQPDGACDSIREANVWLSFWLESGRCPTWKSSPDPSYKAAGSGNVLILYAVDPISCIDLGERNGIRPAWPESVLGLMKFVVVFPTRLVQVGDFRMTALGAAPGIKEALRVDLDNRPLTLGFCYPHPHIPTSLCCHTEDGVTSQATHSFEMGKGFHIGLAWGYPPTLRGRRLLS